MNGLEQAVHDAVEPATAPVIRTALVALDGSPHEEAAVSLAVDWAQRFDIELVGLGVVDAPPGARPAAFLSEFRARCERARVRCTVQGTAGRPDEQIVSEAQSCDLVILGREMKFGLEGHDHDRETLGRVIRQSPRPILVVPASPAAGAGVLVAYGGGREVARTLQTFTCLGLAGEDVVDVIAVDPRDADCRQRLHHASAYLTVHGVAHRARPIVSPAPAASVILDEVRRRQPRLLVMGAYGRHPLRDLFLTSVTQAVLSESPVPVFLGA